MHPDKLDLSQLLSLVEKYGYDAFSRGNPFGAKLAIFSSDLGHFDGCNPRPRPMSWSRTATSLRWISAPSPSPMLRLWGYA
jgi:hypothetical protein